jgi:hypothetical protein
MTRSARKNTQLKRDPEQHARLGNSTAAFVYLLPCRDEDILKVGFSRDPLVRLQTLHARYFDFFDLDRALLVGTESVRDARRLESELAQAAEEHNAPAPLLVPPLAGGHTEWYRGAYALLSEHARNAAAADGFALHQPLRSWLCERMKSRVRDLYEFTTHRLRFIEYARVDAALATAAEAQLRNLLDGFTALGISPSPHLPPDVLGWYQGQEPAA